MPLYPWRLLPSKKEVEVLRKFDDYLVPPTLEECLQAGVTEEEFNEAQWEKIIGKGIRAVRGDSWGPGKGYWGQ